MKNIDFKSLAIGALLGSTICLGVAATSSTDKWDDKQEWLIASRDNLQSANLLKGLTTKQTNGNQLLAQLASCTR